MKQTMANEGAGGAQLRMLCYRAWHRGTREMDLLLGPFADSKAETFSGSELAAFALLLELPDPALHDLIMLGGDVADASENALLKKLRHFHGLWS